MDLGIIKQKAAPVLRRYGISKAAVFGSFARGEQNAGSDIDILIQYSSEAKKSLFTRIKLKNELEDVLQKNVDVVTEKALSPLLRQAVLKEKRDIL